MAEPLYVDLFNPPGQPDEAVSCISQASRLREVKESAHSNMVKLWGSWSGHGGVAHPRTKEPSQRILGSRQAWATEQERKIN